MFTRRGRLLAFLIMMVIPCWSASADPGFWVIGHRGDMLHQDENTLPAMEAALRRGANALEMDVRLTADGVPVIMHDHDVERTTDGEGEVGDLTLPQWKRLRTDLGHRPPTLAEVLEHFSGRPVTLFLEAKQHDQLMLAALSRTLFNYPRARVAVFAPNADFLLALKSLSPRTMVFLPPLRHESSIAKARLLGYDGLLVIDVLCTPDFVRLAHAAGLKVVAARVRSREEARAVRAAGVDGIIVTDPRIAG